VSCCVVNVCLACVRRASRGRCVSGAAHAQCSSSAYVDSSRVGFKPPH